MTVREEFHAHVYFATASRDTIEDVQALAAPVLRHRIVVGFAAESEGGTADSIINQLIETTPAHEDELTRDPRFQTIFAS